MTDTKPAQALLVNLGQNDANAATVRDYLKALLTELWRKDEGFSGKRPFGNSGWQWDIYGPLVKAGLVSGSLDPEGDVMTMDQDAADALIYAAIEAL